MKLLQLKLENFRQHRDSTIDFADGMTAIVGANGTGKSTILEAITFALYAQQRDTADNIRFYWSDGKRFSVTLKFEFDGSLFEVWRAHNDASLTDMTAGLAVVRASGRSEVKRACEKLLGLSYEQFINSFCAEQKNLAFLNFKSGTAQQDEVARMLGFDRLRTVEEIAKAKRGEYRLAIDLLSRSLGNLEEIKTEQKDSEARLAEIERETKKAQERRTQTLVQMAPAEGRRKQAADWLEQSAEMGRILATVDALKHGLKTAEDGLCRDQKEVDEKATLKAPAAEFKQTEAQVKQSEADREADRVREALASDGKRLEIEIADLDKRIADLKAPDLAPIEHELAKLSAQVEDARQTVREKEESWRAEQLLAAGHQAGASSKEIQAREDLSRREKMLALGICPECEQPLNGGYAQGVSARKAELATLQSELEKAQTKVRSLEDRPKALRDAQSAQDQLEAALSKAQAVRDAAAATRMQAKIWTEDRATKAGNLAKKRSELVTIPARYDPNRHESLRKRLDELQAAYNRYLALSAASDRLAVAQRSLAEAKKRHDDARARYRELEAARATLPFADQDAASQAVAQHEALVKELAELDNDLKNAESLRIFAERALDQANQKICEYAQREKELKETKSQEALHNTAALEFKALREELNKSIRPDLIARASENLNLLTHGRYPVLDLDGSFKATVMDDGIPKQVISGGEEDVVALSLRLALSELIQERQGRPMELLVLDEVFGSLDSERRQSVLDRLLALKDRFTQILVISHIEEINQIADQCVYLTRNECTRATVVTDSIPGDVDLMMV